MEFRKWLPTRLLHETALFQEPLCRSSTAIIRKAAQFDLTTPMEDITASCVKAAYGAKGLAGDGVGSCGIAGPGRVGLRSRTEGLGQRRSWGSVSLWQAASGERYCQSDFVYFWVPPPLA